MECDVKSRFLLKNSNYANMILLIGDSFELQDGNTVLAVNFESLHLRLAFSKKSFQEIKDCFQGKEIEIIGAQVQLTTRVIDVEVSSSIANFRTVFLKVKSSSKVNQVQCLDEVHID